MAGSNDAADDIPRFDRRFFSSGEVATKIGGGAIGGKAHGLIRAHRLLEGLPEFPGMPVEIPRMVVVAADVFEHFVARNGLEDLALSDAADDRKALAFMQADLPVEILGDLRAIVEEVRTPLAVRSSSRLEDALAHPFAGVYQTKMTQNAALDPSERFARLVEAVKLVYASAFFRAPLRYLRAVGCAPGDERMAVVIQEVVGQRSGDRFYPHLSGVARSWNFYPGSGVHPEDGVVSLAVGLGKTIVDGGVCWTYSPVRPTAPPPFASNADRANGTQTRFWAVRLGRVDHHPTRETEYLIEADLADAEADGSLRFCASTWDPRSDRLVPGVRGKGARIVDFAPLLVHADPPLNDVVKALLRACEDTWGEAVEIEFAATLAPGPAPTSRFGLLQVRPMASAGERVEVADEHLAADDVLLASMSSMGNGTDTSIQDIVYIRPDRFDASETVAIAAEVERLDAALSAARRPYLLIGIGRWGSSDPWLGVPVRWDQISGARAVVEAMLPRMNVEPSQGAHFFHNVASQGVKYLTVPHGDRTGVDWAWLEAQEEVAVTAHLRHVRLAEPLRIVVDGRTGRAVVRRPPS